MGCVTRVRARGATKSKKKKPSFVPASGWRPREQYGINDDVICDYFSHLGDDVAQQ